VAEACPLGCDPFDIDQRCPTCLITARWGIFSVDELNLLVGTMNSWEGELRPQLLDRFGLCAKAAGINGPKTCIDGHRGDIIALKTAKDLMA